MMKMESFIYQLQSFLYDSLAPKVIIWASGGLIDGVLAYCLGIHEQNEKLKLFTFVLRQTETEASYNTLKAKSRKF